MVGWMLLQLLDAAEAHPIFSAALLVATGALITALNKVPGALWGLVVRQTTVRLEIDGSSPSYKPFDNWLNRHRIADTASTYILAAGDESVVMAPGFGTHYIWRDGKLLIISREHKKEVTSNASFWNEGPKETVTVTAVGIKRSGRSVLQGLIDEIHGEHLVRKGLSVRAWHYGYWFPLGSRINRPLSSVILPAEQKAEMVEHASWFFNSQQWFIDRGIPWRCGFLFKGPPGTGKSSTVCGLGTHFHRPVCIMSLATMSSDNDLLNAFLQAPRNAIILIEDVDAMNSAVTRKPEEKEKIVLGAATPAPATPPEADKKVGITLSGLLNAIDGVAAPEGRLLVLTTNHPEKLDPALTRKARIDKEFFLGPLTPDLVEEMAARFFPDDPEAVATIRSRADLGPNRPAADWQDEFMVRAREGRAA